MSIRRLSNARLYVDGLEHPAKCMSFELPEVEFEQIEYSALGMLGTVELPASINAMEATAVWGQMPPEVNQLMHNPERTSEITLRTDQATYSSQGTPVSGLYVATLRVRPKTMAGGTFEKGEATQPETTFAVDYYSITVNGTVLFEIDAASNIGMKVAGGTVNLVGR